MLPVAIGIAQVIKLAVDLGPGIIKGIEDAAPFVASITSIFSAGGITQEELDVLLADLRKGSAELQAISTDDPPAA